MTVYEDGHEFVTFEYDSKKYNYVSTIIFEEHEKWENIDKETLFKYILEHMTAHIESDEEEEEEN